MRKATERAIQYCRESLVGVTQGSNYWTWGPLLLGLAALAKALGLHRWTAKLLGKTEHVGNTVFRLWPDQRDQLNRLANTARTNLGETRFDAAWTEGWEQEFEQVVEEAVSILEAVIGAQSQPTPAG